MSTSEAQAVAEAVVGNLKGLSWEAICERFPNKWVVIADLTDIDDCEFDYSTGVVIATFDSRKTASSTMRSLIEEGRGPGCFWTGELRFTLPWFLS